MSDIEASLPAQKRFGANLRWQFVANAGQALFGGLFLLAVARILGPSDFGIFSTLMAVVTVAGLVFEMRLNEVVARDFYLLDQGQLRIPEDRLYILDLCLLDSTSRLLPGLGLILFAPLWADLTHVGADHVPLLILASIGFIFSRMGNNIAIGLLRVLGRTDLIALCTIADWGLRLLAVMALAAVMPLSITLTIWVVVLVGSAANLLQCGLALRELRNRMGAGLWRDWSSNQIIPRLLQARRQIMANIGISASDLMAKDLDVALLARFVTEDKIGIYKMAKTAIQLLWRAIDPYYLAILPEVQKLWQQGQYHALKRLLLRTSLLLTGLSILLTGLGCGMASLFAVPILGKGYSEVPSLMLIMAPWVILCAPLIWGLPLCIAINRPEFATYGSFAGLLVGVTAFLSLTPHLGLSGAAIAWNLTLISGVLLTGGLAVFFALQHLSRTLKQD